MKRTATRNLIHSFRSMQLIVFLLGRVAFICKIICNMLNQNKPEVFNVMSTFRMVGLLGNVFLSI